ncbi:MAG: hypothetical protein P4L55_22135 [Syntrophobacteraceae bacterium]|nr:hypothetical protein [Syntrophobacteraceae bacterium]
MKMLWIAMLIVSVVLSAGPARVCAAEASQDTETIPADLAGWKPWVLHGSERRLCPITYDNGEAFQCVWPSRLTMALDGKGGRATQEWRVFVKDWVVLPGGGNVFPRDVKVDGKTAPLLTRNNLPVVRLTPGKHVVQADFAWDEVPEMINIPAASGLVTVSVNGQPLDPSLIDESGRVWLHRRSTAKRQEDRLETKIYRMVDDSIPMQVQNLLRINVSGQGREVKLENPLLPKAIPVSIQSALPAKLGPSGELFLQARPGRWDIMIITRFEGPVHKIGPVSGAFGQEVWSFQPRNQLRMVEVEGLPGIDPKQTNAPREWENFPTYVVQPGATMTLKETRRGDPDPAPDALNLTRTCWLDFDGRGFTLQDRIGGTMSRQHFLAMNPPTLLGRVSVDGTDQLITSQGAGKKSGVELRKGQLNLVAESRYEAPGSTLPAVGWDHDFQSVSTVLCLPPGWRLLTATGVDLMPGSWFQRWTLLDLFVALIISLAVSKLWDYRWGLLALAAVALTYHEPGAPRLVWLPLLAATALLRLLPQGRAKKLVGAFRLLNVVILIVVSIPFMVRQIRCGIYPQLEIPMAADNSVANYEPTPYQAADTLQQYPSAPGAGFSHGRSISATRAKARKSRSSTLKEKAALLQNPDALIQTGPGLPTWRWQSVAMEWSGPVARNQQIRLWLLSPAMNLALAFIRVLLVAFLIFRMIDPNSWKKAGKWSIAVVVLLIPLHLLLLPQAAKADANSSGFPPSQLLEQLRNRLLKAPDCLPSCADSPYMEIAVNDQSLRLLLQINAAADIAVPLPGKAGSWTPEKVLLDDRPAEGLLRDKEGILWILVSPGVHMVQLEGKPPGADSIQLPLPLTPHKAKLVSAGWDVQGIHPDGRVESAVQLTRQKRDNSPIRNMGENRLPPFLHIQRELALGLDWRVTTTISRVTKPGVVIVAKVPLIVGESVTTPGIQVSDGKVLLNMGPAMNFAKWDSTLAQDPLIKLNASSGDGAVGWSESWVLDASPIWHCELKGIPIIHDQDEAGYWRPEWRPWPGENIQIAVTRPEAVPGQLITIDDAALELVPGERLDKVNLNLDIRSSQGGQHSLHLPSQAQLQQVRIDGRPLPVRQNGTAVAIPLHPGVQHIDLEWYQNRGGSLATRGPEVRIGGSGQRAVNASVVFKIPPNRWILLTGGPRLGPAVLFWSYLIIVILAAVALGRTAWTPLKTRHWLLLGLGLTQIAPLAAIMIVGWLLALGVRERREPIQAPFAFNLSQVILAVWTLAAMTGLYSSIKEGLLGIPQMQIAGNGSSDFFLRWMQDRITTTMPRPWVLSLPMIVFRVLMLAWALWLALSLLKWLSWGWQCFGKGAMWRKMARRKKKAAEQEG